MKIHYTIHEISIGWEEPFGMSETPSRCLVEKEDLENERSTDYKRHDFHSIEPPKQIAGHNFRVGLIDCDRSPLGATIIGSDCPERYFAG